jgi:enoyl-CoA hydratase
MERQQIEVRAEQRSEGLVATVVIDNPGRLNSMNSPLMAQFGTAMSKLAQEEHLRVVIITGAGDKAFIGGADIKEMAALRGPQAARDFISRVHACCHAVRAIPVPTIARINGFTFGAGLELAAACDLRVGSEQAVFGMPEVKLGIPSVVEAALLPMLVGWGRTRQMLLLGENFSAQTAEDWGFLDRLVAHDRLDEAVAEWVAQVLTGAPRAVRLQKQLIRSWEDLPLRAAVAAGIDSFAAAFETPEPEQAFAHFLAEQARRKAARYPEDDLDGATEF